MQGGGARRRARESRLSGLSEERVSQLLTCDLRPPSPLAPGPKAHGGGGRRGDKATSCLGEAWALFFLLLGHLGQVMGLERQRAEVSGYLHVS